MKNLKYLLGIVAMACALVANAQTQRFTATVIDELGEPCIGASVIVKGTTQGVMTGVDGSFSIEVPKDAEVEISYIGYVTQTITNFAITQITLAEDRQQIEEVVVVGYGVQKKSHLTGSVATVPVDDIQDLSTGDLASSLKGLVNGVSVSGGDTRPGQSGQIYIRGAKNLGDVGTQAQSPLFVIDGYIYPTEIEGSARNLGEEAFNNLDPASIESISVLKDASAAVYGSRAANGVILVTTKRGKEGAPQISYNGSVGVADSFSQPKMLNAYQYGKLYNAVIAADPTKNNSLDRINLFQKDELEAMKSLDYNLLDQYWRAALTHRHSLNMSGATDKVNYFAGVSYFNQDGNLGKLDYDRWTYRAGVDAKIGRGLKLGVSITGDYGKKNKPFIKVGGSGEENDYQNLLIHPRYIPEYVNGYPVANYGVSNKQINQRQEYHFNELQNLGDYSNNMSSNMNIGANIEYDFSWIKPLKGLSAKLSYSKSISTDKTNEYGSSYEIYRMISRTGSGSHLYTPIAGQEAAYNELVNDPDNFVYSNNAIVTNGGDANNPGTLTRTMYRTDNYQLNFNVAYNRTFGKHAVGGFFSIERSENETEYETASILGISKANSSHQANSGTKDTAQMDFNRGEAGSLSYIGRVNYAYDDKYLLELLIRSDASTKFAPSNYWGLFPSVSAGWVISKEKWMQDVTWLDFLKLRASAGLTGRDNVAAWKWRKSYNIANDKGAVFGPNPDASAGTNITDNDTTAAVNEDLHWDKSYKFNVGLDWNVLSNRLGFNIEYYRQWDRDMLMPFKQSIPGTVGTQSAEFNVGQMDSWGVEFTASWRDRVNSDFSYRIQLNTGYSDNKVLFMDWKTGRSAFTEIQPYGRTDTGLWGMQAIGMFRSFQEIEEYFDRYMLKDDGTYGQYMGKNKDEVRPGMLIYKDVGSFANDQHSDKPDHEINREDDRILISNRSSNPWGFTLNFGIDWKGLSVTAQLNASWGTYRMIPATKVALEGSIATALEYTNAPAYWNPDNMFVYQDIYDAAGNVVVAQNRDAYYPSLAYSDVNSEPSTFWAVSGAQVSLNRLTIAYTLPKKWTNAIGISSCRINVTGQNLFYFNNPFPENFTNLFNADYTKYPSLRRFTIGLNLTF